MGFFCFFNLYALRVNLSVALVSMVNVTYMKQLEAENALSQNATIRTDSVICHTGNTTETGVNVSLCYDDADGGRGGGY